MANSLDNRQDITQLQVQHVVQRALSLSKQINATIEDVGQENIDKQAIMMIREFKAGKTLIVFHLLVNDVNFNSSMFVLNYSNL